ncbi:hypothetical protein GsuE55_08590 [Geobacillus subterraneus]|uniref:Uncharacterized protein n=1 Tax=Geobacillus subterraneus TaxID=129338 RepID=A0A679FQF7_9BACL|nr:hypothetical protein GsuE55_08590 [Geobacillus subterraneus]
MDESMRHDIALFRYGLIAPLVNGQVEPKAYLNEVGGRVHSIPHQGDKLIATKTILDWCARYKKGGFDALKAKRRSDRGRSRRLSPDDEDHILALRKEHPTMPVTVFYEQLTKQGDIPTTLSYFTIYRLLKKHNLVGKEILPMPERKRLHMTRSMSYGKETYPMDPRFASMGKPRKRF